jgi:hypothetical protein
LRELNDLCYQFSAKISNMKLIFVFCVIFLLTNSQATAYTQKEKILLALYGHALKQAKIYPNSHPDSFAAFVENSDTQCIYERLNLLPGPGLSDEEQNEISTNIQNYRRESMALIIAVSLCASGESNITHSYTKLEHEFRKNELTPHLACFQIHLRDIVGNSRLTVVDEKANYNCHKFKKLFEELSANGDVNFDAVPDECAEKYKLAEEVIFYSKIILTNYNSDEFTETVRDEELGRVNSLMVASREELLECLLR